MSADAGGSLEDFASTGGCGLHAGSREPWRGTSTWLGHEICTVGLPGSAITAAGTGLSNVGGNTPLRPGRCSQEGPGHGLLLARFSRDGMTALIMPERIVGHDEASISAEDFDS